ncbi:bifunctional diaminohydroxyphosphoribosylaminopyrimidine deaminase/5-amino-6-(5-phosphoribosylamino)uracil reductase RibD [Sediminibacillus massiliensis]|uniref:bifunctional diaminohydroxyphosphoribosylaminopyrimidine deaminase/5-amino-6-(5-phosphoribosylamino)uracil reductase RibD n=1 Tax=Sediminibacillus massiliensis TaxID=1926277 RepID=UPI00098888AC|nr:bifunctional diaminohydroxyphosphoribosylaminopyrimidine deaminase/5-amino-6-(5-phosphoribosylamino)uracil reductase RibD [Sediminibacillus massiliensis]
MSKQKYMEIALQAAEATIGQTSPNPSVGAVVVKDGRIIGMGSHLKAGTEHAEVHALNQAGKQAEGAEMYVTLEPCSHHGKTPPCADLIIDYKLRKVYVACLDPNPEVAGRGVEKLRSAGIEVETGVMEARAKKLNRKFFRFIQSNRPYVTLKAAMTLDGKTAAGSGDSKWITSEESRHDVHIQRDLHDAILVGINTVLKDDPMLTARLPQGGKHPIRVVLDTQLKIPEDSKLLQSDEAETWLICGSNADKSQEKFRRKHVTVWQLDTSVIDLEDVLSLLGRQQIQSLYVEGGMGIHGSFIERRLFDECHWYIAPKLLGGLNSYSAVGGRTPEFMGDAADLIIESMEQLGPDIKVTAYPDNKEEV